MYHSAWLDNSELVALSLLGTQSGWEKETKTEQCFVGDPYEG